jgi:hypothetical protein
VEWLVFETSPTTSTVELLHGLVQRLCGAGFELIRLNLQVRQLSPQAALVIYTWRPAARSMELSPLAARVGEEEQHVLDGGLVCSESMSEKQLVQAAGQRAHVWSHSVLR